MQERIRELRNLLQERSISHGDFTLASGAKSSYYCDVRVTAMSPRGADLIGEILFELLEARDVEAVGGMALGSVFLSTAVSLVSSRHGRPMYGFAVRPAAKDHGTGRKVEQSYHPDGQPLLRPGRRVAIVEDTVTTGGSLLKAIDAIEELGCEVTCVVALVDRRAGGADRLRERGLTYLHLFETDTEGTLHLTELAAAGNAT